MPVQPFAHAIVIHLFIQIPDYNRLMPTFIAAAALYRRRCVSPWHACVVSSSDKELRALRRAPCDRTQPMRSLPLASLATLVERVCDYTREIRRSAISSNSGRSSHRATSRDQLISTVENPSRLKRRTHCDCLRPVTGGWLTSLKNGTRVFDCRLDT